MTTTPPLRLREVESIAVGQLAAGMVVSTRKPGGGLAEQKTVQAVTRGTGIPAKAAVTVTWTDGSPANTWFPHLQITVMADSLPATYWRTKLAAITYDLDKMTEAWLTMAVGLNRPTTQGTEPQVSRNARARQMRICAASVSSVIHPNDGSKVVLSR